MNETTPFDSTSKIPTLTSVYPPKTPDAFAMPDREKQTAAAADAIEQAVQGVHATIDRLADRAVPAVKQLAEQAVAAQDALGAKTEQLRETGDAWAASVRATVRDNPLAAMAAALALGLLLARVTRSTSASR